MTTVFYSWQADRPTTTGRNLVEKALRQAIKELKSDAEIEEPIRDTLALDKDTQGVGGSPPIAETIFQKIDEATVFVPDVTFVGLRADGRPMANPNVLIEYGWASKALTHKRIIAVMNTAYGAPNSQTLPFDMIHLRHPIQYSCEECADEATRKIACDNLVKQLKVALAAVLGDSSTKPSRPSPPLFEARQPLHGQSHFRGSVEPIGAPHSSFSFGLINHSALYLPVAAASMWLRLMPQYAIEPAFSVSTKKIETALTATGNILLPLNGADAGNIHYIRGIDGFGVSVGLREENIGSVIYGFTNGEVWTIDTLRLTYAPNVIYFNEDKFSICLADCATYLKRLGINGPYRWIAGLEGIAKRGFIPEGRTVPMQNPVILVDCVMAEGEFSGEPVDAKSALIPFFERVFGAAHLTR